MIPYVQKIWREGKGEGFISQETLKLKQIKSETAYANVEGKENKSAALLKIKNQLYLLSSTNIQHHAGFKIKSVLVDLVLKKGKMSRSGLVFYYYHFN